jgi:hypothetical protein
MTVLAVLKDAVLGLSRDLLFSRCDHFGNIGRVFPPLVGRSANAMAQVPMEMNLEFCQLSAVRISVGAFDPIVCSPGRSPRAFFFRRSSPPSGAIIDFALLSWYK